jgi:hypothetical protein
VLYARWLLVISGLVVLPIFGAALAVDWGTSVVVLDADGKVLSRYPLPDSGDFEIEYAHSYYGVSAVERFSADPRGGFGLVEISSPSEAVLDYYELEGRKAADGEWIRLVPKETRRFEELPLIGTATGQKTLVVSGEPLPLYAGDDPVHLTIRVEEDSFPTELREVLSG